MDYLPIFADVRNRRALVVGDGVAARRKIDLLRNAGADVRVLGALEFRNEDVQGCVAVFGATGDQAIDRQVAAAARAAGVPVNVVDRPELSTFIMPAIVDRSPVIVAISSGGAAPVLARTLRARIEALLPPRLGDLARFAGRFRGAVRHLIGDPAARRRFWESFFDGPVAARVLAGEARAHGEMVALVNRTPDAPKGAVYVIGVGAGDDADLLTLQAVRLMQHADLVVTDEPIATNILDRARRDAEQLRVNKDELHQRLAREAGSGKRVVWLATGPRPLEIDHLRRHGIEVVIAPGLTPALVDSWQAEERRRKAV